MKFQEIPSTSLTTLKLLTLWITTNWKILKVMEVLDHLTCLLGNLYADKKKTVRTGHRIADWERSPSRRYTVTLPIGLLCTVHHVKCLHGWSTSWNQDCWEKYQEPQVCRWYHLNGRKWRGTKEPIDEEEGVKKLGYTSTFKKLRS